MKKTLAIIKLMEQDDVDDESPKRVGPVDLLFGAEKP
jgi:hypothetical protein